MHDLVPLFVASFWPVTVLILAFTFSKGIKALIASTAELKIGNSIFLKWSQAEIDSDDEAKKLIGRLAPKQIDAPSTVKLNKPADLFWLGSDLETTAQRALRGAPKGKISHGLTQCHHRISELGLKDSGPGRKLSSLKSQVQVMTEQALDREWRNDFAESIHSIINEVSGLLRAEQPDFRAFPDRT